MIVIATIYDHMTTLSDVRIEEKRKLWIPSPDQRILGRVSVVCSETAETTPCSATAPIVQLRSVILHRLFQASCLLCVWESSRCGIPPGLGWRSNGGTAVRILVNGRPVYTFAALYGNHGVSTRQIMHCANIYLNSWL